MTTDDAISHYGSQSKLAAALGINQSAVAAWGEHPPKLRQLQLHQITRGKLRADPAILAPKRAA